MLARDLLRLLAVDPGEDAAQHRRILLSGDTGNPGKTGAEAFDLVGLDVDEEVGWGDVGQVAGDGAPQVPVDLAHGGEDRKPEAERQDDRRRLLPRPADGGEGKAQRRATARVPAHAAGEAAQKQRGEGQEEERANDAAERPHREATGIGKPDGGKAKRRDQRDKDERERPAGPAPAFGAEVAEKRRGAHGAGAGERPEREDERRQRAVERSLGQRPGVEADGHRNRKLCGDQRRGEHRQARAEDQPGRKADGGQRRHLDEIGGEDRPPRRAERLQRGDRLDLAVEIGPHRRGDADAADGEAREADEYKERTHPVHEPLHPWRAVAGILPAHPAVAERLHGQPAEGADLGARRQQEPVARAEQAAGLEQARRREVRRADDGARPDREAAGGAVRFPVDHRRKAELLPAELEPFARLQAKPVGQDRVHQRAGRAARGRESLCRCHRRRERQRPRQRIGVVHGLDLGQRPLCPGPLALDRHRAEIDDLGHPGGVLRHEGAFRIGREAVGEGHLRVAAKQDSSLFDQRPVDGAAHGADRRDGGNAQRQAGEEDGKAAKPAPQLAPREAEGGGQPHSATPASGAVALSSPTISPSARRTMRSQRTASSGAWVTRTSVAPWRSRRPKSRSMIVAPVAPSRLPVGSSARRIAGRVTAARASATRCCSPPESCAG